MIGAQSRSAAKSSASRTSVLQRSAASNRSMLRRFQRLRRPASRSSKRWVYVGHRFAAALAHVAHDDGRRRVHVFCALGAAQGEELRELVGEARASVASKRRMLMAAVFSWSGLRRVGHAGPMSASVTSRHSTVSSICVCAGEGQRHWCRPAARPAGSKLIVHQRMHARRCPSKPCAAAHALHAGERQHGARTEERHALAGPLPLEAVDLQPKRPRAASRA